MIYSLCKTGKLILVFLLLVSVQFRVSAQIDLKKLPKSIDTTELKDLRSRYPWGSIYITYNTCFTLDEILEKKGSNSSPKPATGGMPTSTIQLSAPDRNTGLLKSETSQNALNKLGNTVKKISQTQINKSIAFLALNLNELKAGQKMIEDDNGTVQQLAWSAEEVFEIAKFCDNHLNQRLIARQFIEYISTDNFKVESAVSRLNTIVNNEYSSDIINYILIDNFKSKTGKDSALLSAISKSDTGLYTQIMNLFKYRDDRYLNYTTIDFSVNPDYANLATPYTGANCYSGIISPNYGNPNTVSLFQGGLFYSSEDNLHLNSINKYIPNLNSPQAQAQALSSNPTYLVRKLKPVVEMITQSLIVH